MAGFAVYTLCDPQTDEIRYVGYSMRMSERYKWHVDHEDTVTYRGCWVAKLKHNGLTPALKVLCIVQEVDEAKRVEIALIAAYRQRGLRLTNGTSGGDGVSGTPEVRAKQALAASVPCSPEKKAKISATLMGRPPTPEQLVILQNASYRMTPEQIENRNRQIAKAWTVDRRVEESLKVSQRLTPEHQAKMVEAARKVCLGKPRSEKDRAAMRAGCARRKARKEAEKKLSVSELGVL